MQFARFRFFKKFLNGVESITGHFCHQWYVLLWPKLHSPNVLRAANDDDIRVMMIATSRVTLIVPACKPGWEEMESLRQSSYLSQISQIIFVEKNCHVEIFWEILGYFEKIWESLGNFATIYALSCGEKLSPKCTYLEKNDKYEV